MCFAAQRAGILGCLLVFQMFELSLAIRLEIARIVEKVADSCDVLDVYLAARDIQSKHQFENTALEDIVAAFILAATGKTVVMELDRRIASADDLRSEGGIHGLHLPSSTIH